MISGIPVVSDRCLYGRDVEGGKGSAARSKRFIRSAVDYRKVHVCSKMNSDAHVTTAVGRRSRAVSWFATHVVTYARVRTENGSCDRSVRYQ